MEVDFRGKGPARPERTGCQIKSKMCSPPDMNGLYPETVRASSLDREVLPVRKAAEVAMDFANLSPSGLMTEKPWSVSALHGDSVIENNKPRLVADQRE